MRINSLFVAFLICVGRALAATCPECDGDRVVGSGPIKSVCDQCRGTGEFNLRAAVVRVELPEALGSGVLVRRDLVVTAEHVIDDAGDDVKVILHDGTVRAAKVVGEDAMWDLAALAIDEVDVTPAVVSVDRPRKGDRLTLAGLGGLDEAYRETTGRCTGMWLAPGRSSDADLVEVDIWNRKGDSGGAFADSRGRLVGVMSARGKHTKDTHGAYGGRVKTFLDSVESQR